MKVIKNNQNFDNVFPMTVTCARVVDKYGFSYGDEVYFCGSELEIEAYDIRKRDWQKYPDFSGTDYGVVCPVCKNFVVIDRDKIPKKIKDEAENAKFNN